MSPPRRRADVRCCSESRWFCALLRSSMMAVGLAIELVSGDLLFETYLSTFSGWGIIFAVIALLARPPRML